MNPMLRNSLGLIGGADGPTVMYATTTADAVLWLSVVLTVAAFGVIFRQRRHTH